MTFVPFLVFPRLCFDVTVAMFRRSKEINMQYSTKYVAHFGIVCVNCWGWSMWAQSWIWIGFIHGLDWIGLAEM